MIEGNLRNSGTGASNVAGWSVNEKVLAGAVQPVLAGDLGGFEEGGPGELVDCIVVIAPGVRTGDADIVAGVADVSIDEQAVADGSIRGRTHCVHHAIRRFGVTTNRTDVRFEHRNGQIHVSFPSHARATGNCCRRQIIPFECGKLRLHDSIEQAKLSI